MALAQFILFLSISLVYRECVCYKFLVVVPTLSRSHGNLAEAILRILLEANHEVTYITAIPTNKTHTNLRKIDISYKRFMEPGTIRKLMTDYNDYPKYKLISLVLGMAYKMANVTVNHKNAQKLLMDEKEQFDAVISTWNFIEIVSGFSAVFQCPLIWVTSMHPHTLELSALDEIPNPAYTYSYFYVTDSPHSFIDRIYRLIYFLLEQIFKWSYFDLEAQIYIKGFGPAAAKRGQVLPSYEEIMYNASLVLSNHHDSIGPSFTLPPYYKQVAGFHIPEEVSKLPEYLQKVMDTAKNGVIYFSLGSIIQSEYIPKDIQKNILSMLGELEQTVIWKYEGDIDNLPKNVHIVKWAPQKSILAHPNCVLFITHGGRQSSLEALHFGIPIIGIPMFGDQFHNVERGVRNGYASRFALRDGASKLKEIICDMIKNPRYRQKAKEHSLVFHHRPVPPAKEVLHWIEHVVLTGGAPHLRPVGRDVPLYQKLYLDLVVLIIIIITIAINVVKRIINYCKVYLFNKELRSLKKNN